VRWFIVWALLTLCWRPARADPPVTMMVPIGGGQSVRMHKIGTLPTARAAELVRLADLSTCTTTPVTGSCNGLIEPGDRVVVTDRFVVWLDLTPGALEITNGGGGLARGLWSIACCDGTGQYNFAHIENPDAWAPNELFPGADGASGQGSGMSIQLRLIENQDVPDPHSMGAENAQATLTADGDPICDGGLFQGTGILVQTTGYLAHFERDPAVLAAHGFSSFEDANADPAVTSRLRFTITYRFSPDAVRFRQQVRLEVVDGPTSFIAAYGMSNCTMGGQPWSAQYTGADVGRIHNLGVSPPSCSRSPTVAPGQIVPFNLGVIGTNGLDYFESNAQGMPGYAWFLTAQAGIGGRTFSLTLPAGPGYVVPERVQGLLNGYSAPGVGVACLDIGYADANQCETGQGWPVGFVHATATDYYTDPSLPQTGAWPDGMGAGMPPPCLADGGAPEGGAADAALPDGGARDSSVANPEAGIRADGGAGATGLSSGCGCAVGARGGPTHGLLLLALLLVAAGRRRPGAVRSPGPDAARWRRWRLRCPTARPARARPRR